MTLAKIFETMLHTTCSQRDENAFDALEDFERENLLVERRTFEGCGWSCKSRIFKDGSVYGYSGAYRDQLSLWTFFQD